MKAIILCAGLGTRLRPLTHSTAKHLIPVANKPVLFYALESLAQVGVEDVGIIVSRESWPIIAAAVDDGSQWGLRVQYIEQSVPRGLAHACQCAESFVGSDPFVMYLGDNLIPEGLTGAVSRFRSSDAEAVIMLKEVPDPRAFGIAELSGETIVRLVEKPVEPRSNLAIVGGYVFQPEIFESIRRIKPSSRNELEITDAIQNLIERGFAVAPYVVEGWWKDAGKPEDILDANRAVLDVMEHCMAGECDAETSIVGNVTIGLGARVEGSRLVGPLVIGANAHVSRCRIGPYVSLGDGVDVRDSVVENSVVLARTRIVDLDGDGLRDSLIGGEAIVEGGANGSAVRLLLGDNCVVRFEKGRDSIAK